MLPILFLDRMRRLLGEEADRFVQAFDLLPKRGLRVNTLKCNAETIYKAFGDRVKPVPFCANGWELFDRDFRPSTDPLHHAGAYYMQEPSAMSAVTTLAPQPHEWVLDTCAAPGGKSTQIASALAGTGLLWCNEFMPARAKILQQNLERCGVTNAVVSQSDVPSLCAGLTGMFDAVLVDAPCSGEGMFRKEPEALAQWSLDNIRLCADRQSSILDAAAEAVRPGGRLVYSTCTFAPEENECQIGRFLLTHPDFVLEPIDESYGQAGFAGDVLLPFSDDRRVAELPLERTRRVFPWQGGEGHFVALLRRTGDGEPYRSSQTISMPAPAIRTAFDTLAQQCFAQPSTGVATVFGQTVRLLPETLPDLRGKRVLSAGLAAAEICKNRLEPSHAWFMSRTPDACVSVISLTRDSDEAIAFLRGETIPAGEAVSWTAVAVDGVICGFGKSSGGVLKNRYPKGLRLYR